MPLYTKQSLQMLVDLINQSNPSLPVPLTTTNVLYGTPAVVTPTGSNIQNTSIKVTAAAGTKYIGNTTLLYRRIDLSVLFRSLPIVIYKYSAAGTGASPYKISDLLPAINAKYGLNLTTADVVDASLPAGNSSGIPAIGVPSGTRASSITVTTQTTSPGYVGSFTLYWVQAPQDISTMITVTSLETARQFPNGVSTIPGDGSVPYVVDLDTFGVDFTQALNQIATTNNWTLSALITYLTTAAIGTTNATYQAAQNALIAAINAASGANYVNTSPASTSFSLYGITIKHLAAPSMPVEADTKYFNSCLVIDLLAANNWGAGRMILHYNV